MMLLIGNDLALHRLVGQRPRLNFQALLAIKGVLANPIFISTDAIGPQFDSGNRRWIRHVIQSRSQTGSEGSKGMATGSLPEESCHAAHIRLTTGALTLPVDCLKRVSVRENGAIREMKLSIRT